MKLERAYTWAEPGYRITQPSDRFLLASCSKMFLEGAVQALYDTNKLKPTTKVYSLLGFSGPLEPRSDDITVQQLLDHMGGYDDTGTGSSTFDPTYAMRDIAIALNLGHKVGKLDVCTYVYKQRKLDWKPGQISKYSNFGYLLASAVVERVTGGDYFAYVKKALLDPAGITQVEVRPTAASAQPPQEGLIADEYLGLSALDPASPLLVPAIFGGDGELNEVGAALRGDVGLCDRDGAVHRQARRLGQRAARCGRCARRQRARIVDMGRVAGRRRRLGLHDQHAQLAAERGPGARCPRQGDRRAAERDAAAVSRRAR